MWKQFTKAVYVGIPSVLRDRRRGWMDIFKEIGLQQNGIGTL